MKFDSAYCLETDSVLTIYQVRDLHFDEDEDFDSKHNNYFCPDEDCNVQLYGVNDAAVEYKSTPHFRTKPKILHSVKCDYDGKNSQTKGAVSEQKRENSHKISDIPERFIFETQKHPMGPNAGLNNKIRTRKQKENNYEFDRESVSPHETSVLEHIVHVWKTNDDNMLKKSFIYLGNKHKSYYKAFKKIGFFTDEEGLIYYGRIKKITQYGENYAIEFDGKARAEVGGDEWLKVSIYIKEEQIDSYRKRKLFKKHIQSLINISENDDIECFFVGAYPERKTVKIKDGSFDVFNVEVTNLDHLVLLMNKGGDE